MARRKDDSFVDVFSAIFLRTSPWLSLPAALLGFTFVYIVVAVAASVNPLFKGLIQLAPLFGGGVAMLILLAGLKAMLDGWSRRALLSKQSGIESIRSLSWSQFELLVGEAYRQKGYTVTETGQSGPDGGIDLKLRRAGELTLVQCKHWKTWKVSVGPIRELYGVITAEKADRGIFITSGAFTSDARTFAAGKPLELIDGEGLLGLLPSTAHASVNLSAQVTHSPAPAPACPKCRNSMVPRTSRTGKTAGDQFWGCSKFPICRGTRQMA
jgi:restriction system protein